MNRARQKEVMDKIYAICKDLPKTGLTSREIAVADIELSHLLFMEGYDIFTAGDYIARLIRNGMRRRYSADYPEMAYVRSMWIKRKGKAGQRRKKKVWIKIPPGDKKWKEHQDEFDKRAKGYIKYSLETEEPSEIDVPLESTKAALIESGKIQAKDLKKKAKKKVKAT